MAIPIGWRATAVRPRSPIDKWDGVDLHAEYERGLALRNDVHDALGRVAAAISLRFPKLLEDWVDALILDCSEAGSGRSTSTRAGGSVEVFVTSGDPFHRGEIE
jgi:hypothetical protein